MDLLLLPLWDGPDGIEGLGSGDGIVLDLRQGGPLGLPIRGHRLSERGGGSRRGGAGGSRGRRRRIGGDEIHERGSGGLLAGGHGFGGGLGFGEAAMREIARASTRTHLPLNDGKEGETMATSRPTNGRFLIACLRSSFPNPRTR